LARLASVAPFASPVGRVVARAGAAHRGRQKIICPGLNYRDHASEAGLQEPSPQMFFAKWMNSLIGPTAPIVPTGDYSRPGQDR
jgi:2-keto-4-pentenoate hydratase/2-oxohepta-3-ene-1,7-dioic acid hydratase in catechol pathway